MFSWPALSSYKKRLNQQRWNIIPKQLFTTCINDLIGHANSACALRLARYTWRVLGQFLCRRHLQSSWSWFAPSGRKEGSHSSHQVPPHVWMFDVNQRKLLLRSFSFLVITKPTELILVGFRGGASVSDYRPKVVTLKPQTRRALAFRNFELSMN